MLEEDFGSDTDDDDYVPDGDSHQHLSEEEGSGDEEKVDNDIKTNISGKRRRGKQEKTSTFSRNADSQAKQDWQKYEDEIQKEKKSVDEEARIDSLWSAFKSDVKSTKPKSVELSSQCTTATEVSSSKTTTTTTTSTKPSSSGGSRFSSLFDPSPSPTLTENKDPPKAKSRFGSLFDTSDDTKKKDNDDVTSDKQINNGDKVAITKVYDFAGEVVKVTKQVDANSREAKKFKDNELDAETSNSGEAVQGKRKAGGLASIVGSITGKKTKMGCLDKSKLDWNQFTEQEGIQEELASFNRGKDGFVEKQMFLERADQRQFQIEKAIRDKNRKTFMK